MNTIRKALALVGNPGFGAAICIATGAALVVANGVCHAHHVARVCTATANPSLCELSLDAGDSDTAAHAAGNL